MTPRHAILMLVIAGLVLTPVAGAVGPLVGCCPPLVVGTAAGDAPAADAGTAAGHACCSMVPARDAGVPDPGEDHHPVKPSGCECPMPCCAVKAPMAAGGWSSPAEFPPAAGDAVSTVARVVSHESAGGLKRPPRVGVSL